MFNMFDEDNASQLSSAYESSSSTSSSSSYSSSVAPISKEKIYVISAGGSVFIKDEIDVGKIERFCELINGMNGEGFRFVIVLGGGKTARKYISAAKELGANNFGMDRVGIIVTRLNGMLFLNKIDNVYKKVIEDLNEIDVLINNYTLVVGGTTEGQTSDAVAALIAEKLNAKFINLSDVDGIYDKDPDENSDAHLFEELSFNDVALLLRDSETIPGQHTFLDKHAAEILMRSKIRSAFLNGNHLENFENYLRGNSFRGTIVDDVEDVIEKEEFREVFEEEIEEIKPKKLIKKRKKVSRKIVKEKEIDPRDIDFR